MKEVKTYYLIGWNDYNHNTIYWLNDKFLGYGMDTLVKAVIDLQIKPPFEIKLIELTGDNFPKEYWEEIFDYFQTIPDLTQSDIDLIVNEDWEKFYEINC